MNTILKLIQLDLDILNEGYSDPAEFEFIQDRISKLTKMLLEHFLD